MRFLIHGKFHDSVRKALAKQEQTSHGMDELPADAQAESAEDLLRLVAKQQWNLITNDAALIHDLYEQKIVFGGVIVQILDELETAKAQAEAIERLFERYKRLTPRRMYTVTASRVKIRQLPGGHE